MKSHKIFLFLAVLVMSFATASAVKAECLNKTQTNKMCVGDKYCEGEERGVEWPDKDNAGNPKCHGDSQLKTVDDVIEACAKSDKIMDPPACDSGCEDKGKSLTSQSSTATCCSRETTRMCEGS